MEKETVDARGLSCPQPVLMVMDKMRSLGKGKIEVMVDTDTAKENIVRAAESQGWQVKEIISEDMEYRLTLIKE
ncbi:MAG: preprotein translocase subunit TatB [Deltaproteobacteria bacterium]|nr:MAG: preprotein translocase subunit TatB [Deltaproteobacteria bacterium]